MSMVSQPVRLKSSRGNAGRNQSTLNSKAGLTAQAVISARSLATRPDCGPVRLTIEKLSEEHQRSSRPGRPWRMPRHKPDSGGAPHRTPMDSQPGHNLLTSHFQMGARGAVLAALKQHSHAPQRREVKVQLLDPAQSSSSSTSHHSAQAGGECLSGNLGDTMNAHTTAAAPLAQSDMEAGGFQRGYIVDRLGGASGRSQVTPQPTEAALPSRQLESQSQYLGSALSVVTPVSSTTSDPACQQVTKVDSAVNITSSTRTSVETGPVTMATHTDQTREAHHHRDPPIVSAATQANDSQEAMEAGLAEAEALLVQSGPEVTSMLEEASQVLRQVQRQKKVLEENLEAVERVRTGEILQSQLEALVANRDESEQVRIKRTVDAWIHLISRDVKAKMKREASHRRRADASSFPLSPQRVVGSRGAAHTGKTASLPRGTGNKTMAGSKAAAAAAGRGYRSQIAGKSAGAGPAPGFERLDDESYLTRLYGITPQDSLRPSPGKSHYPPVTSLNANSLTSRKPRPHFMEPLRGRGRMKQEVEQIPSVSGVKAKPWKTETSVGVPLNSSPGQHLSSHLTPRGLSVTPAETAIAVPLGHPRIGPSPRFRQKVTSPPVVFSSMDHTAPEPPRCRQKVPSPSVVLTVDHTAPQPPRGEQKVTSQPVVFSSVDHTAPEPPRCRQKVPSPPVVLAVDHTAPEPPRCRQKVPSPPVVFSSMDHIAPEPPRGEQKVTSPPVVLAVDHTAPQPPRGEQKVTSPPVVLSVDHTTPEPPRGVQKMTTPPVILSSMDHTAPQPPRGEQKVTSPPVILAVDHTAPEPPRGEQKVTSPPVVLSVDHTAPEPPRGEPKVSPPPVIFSTMEHTAPEPPRCEQKVSPPPAIFSSMDHTAPEPPRGEQKVTSPPVVLSVDHTAPEPPRCEQKVSPPPVIFSSMDHASPEPPSHQVEPVDAGEAPPPPSITVNITGRKNEEDAEEEDGFPGNDFLFATDVVQGEESVPSEEGICLEGGPSPTLVQHQGPVFPCQTFDLHPVRHHHSSVARVDDDLVKRLAMRVEQQLMSTMISDLYAPQPPDPGQNDITDQSEVERSLTSDIVEAAGGGGLQLFVDSNVPVDSVLIRQLVHEVLAEIVAQVLEQREAPDPGARPGEEPPGPEPHTADEEKVSSVVPTPVPTPVLSPVPSIRDPLLLATPPSSEAASLLVEEDSSHQITAREPVATPIPTPEPIYSAETPPVVRQATPSLSLVDPELPLEEEKPEEHLDEQQLDEHAKPQMTSAEEQQPLPLASPPPRPDPESPCSVSDDGSSSPTTGSDTALKLVSEGELLISFNQPDAMTEECSFSSSLQDTDIDPPSEGQVKGCMSQMEHGHTHTGAWRRQDDLSVGEVPHAYRERLRSTTPEHVARINSCAADATNDSLNVTSDLHSQLSPSQVSHPDDTHTAGQVMQFKELSATQTGQQEVSNGTCVPPEKISSDDSSDLF
uniref:protein TALPID3-like isoform X2 n=1 Tax=Doryrhamphus excisus TaxID=161450 RepID=UPI0025AE8DE8|nr:protein TALPID3-like isoform X2 [Doryrhamphus excisus]